MGNLNSEQKSMLGWPGRDKNYYDDKFRGAVANIMARNSHWMKLAPPGATKEEIESTHKRLSVYGYKRDGGLTGAIGTDIERGMDGKGRLSIMTDSQQPGV